MKFDLGIRADFLLSMAGGKAETETGQFIGLKDGSIAAVEKFKPAHKKASKKFIDAKGQACIPGLVNGHTHLPMALFRGVSEDLSFHDWLFKRILPLEAKLVTKEFVRDGLELAALECIRFGVTTVNEMYFYAAEEAAVLDKAGLRALIAQTMASFPMPEDKVLGPDKFPIVEKLHAKYSRHPRLRVGYGPHAPYSCNDDLLARVAQVSSENRAHVHIHLSETAQEVEDSREKHGMSPVERIHRLGLLKKGTICAHCVHLDEKDRNLLQKSGASATYNPDSNSKLGVGVAPVTDYLKRAIPVCLGTDGSASNNSLSMLSAVNVGAKLQKLVSGDIRDFPASDALSCGTWGGARALGLGEVTGSIEIGKRADLVLLDLRLPHMQPLHDLPSQLVYSANGSEVVTTICEGKILFHQGKFTTLNEKKIYAKADGWRKKIQKAMAEG
ncbi:MAG TPA: amidohydrolase [Bdellovibrionota bacterium]|jgi:5-methylthioadenosine/S-adenosylhomocysteine deaminase